MTRFFVTSWPSENKQYKDRAELWEKPPAEFANVAIEGHSGREVYCPERTPDMRRSALPCSEAARLFR